MILAWCGRGLACEVMAKTDVILTPDQRVRVFISSTLEELAPERAAARRAIARLHLVPVWYESGARPHEVCSQRHLGGAHRPDVQVVHLGDPGEGCEVGLDLLGIDILRHGVEREIE